MSHKTYPISCQSAYCGRSTCEGCRNKPDLDAFNTWVKLNNAVALDPIWSPTVYTAQPKGKTA